MAGAEALQCITSRGAPSRHCDQCGTPHALHARLGGAEFAVLVLCVVLVCLHQPLLCCLTPLWLLRQALTFVCHCRRVHQASTARVVEVVEKEAVGSGNAVVLICHNAPAGKTAAFLPSAALMGPCMKAETKPIGMASRPSRVSHIRSFHLTCSGHCTIHRGHISPP